MYAAGAWQLKPCQKCAFNGPEARSEGRGLNTPTTAPSCPSKTSIKFGLTIGSPPEVHEQRHHYNKYIKCPFHHTLAQ